MLKLDQNYSDYTDETDSNYPEGKAINASSSESYDGTPLLAEFMNDVNASHIAMYEKAYGERTGISGKADTQKSSQFADAVAKYTDDKVKAHTDQRGLANGVHGATSEATPGQIVSRDEYGCAKFAPPLELSDAARKAEIEELLKALNERILVGEIKAYAGIIDDTHPVPTGWLVCDGSEVSKETYLSLYEVVGDSYGAASDTSKFKIPDYRECALVGAGENTTHTIASHDVYSVGEFKDDQLQGHWHRVFDFGYTGGGGGADGWATGYQSAKKDATTIKSDNVNGTPRIGSTTHGKQIGINYLIRY